MIPMSLRYGFLLISTSFLLIAAIPALAINTPPSLSLPQNTIEQSNSSLFGNASHIHSLTGLWDAKCHTLPGPSKPRFLPPACKIVTDHLCLHLHGLEPEEVERDKWYWVELQRCAAGYYLSAEAYTPSKSRCTLIMEEIVDTCVGKSDSPYNAGSNNVEVMPDFAQNGRAEDPRHAMFVVASESLTL